ncbi:CapA family protein [Paenibacillus kobensis]|uniref:CapA family protein n=1 Tax=Paenibacillus kobensis TaxID=59841 RepID=UPI000FD89CAE|nr:CapA family protein [Paenibacillus kobensis]
MYVSRSESHQQNKKRKQRRIRKIAILNLAMIAVILILAAVFWSTLFPADSTTEPEKQNETAGSIGKTPESEPPNAGSPIEDGGTEQTDDLQTDKGGASGEGTGDQQGQASGEGTSSPGTGEEPEGDKESSSSDDQSASSGDTVKLAFVGDIMLGSTVETTMRSKGLEYPFSGAVDYLALADLTAGNLENPITTRGTPAQNKQYVFKGAPDLLPPLKDAGFDVVSVANNHTLDQGAEGLLDTIKHLDEAGVPSVGGGNDDTEAYAPVILEANGIKVAYLGISRVLPVTEWKADKNHPGVAEGYDPKRAVAAIEKAKEQADLVVVMVHWGVERAENPVDEQTNLGKQMIDAGADLIIGSHPHVLQGFEQYKGKWIAYSLGNFIFNVTATPRTKDTGVLDAVCTKSGECKLAFHPMVADQSRPAPAEPDKATEIIDYLSRISIGAKVDQDGYITAQ